MLEQRILSAGMSAILAGSLITVSAGVRADDATPRAPTNVPTAPPDPTTSAEYGSSEARFVEEPTRTSTKEPTFKAESTRQTWPNRPLLATGATVFSVSYLPAVIGGALADDAPNRKDLFIPVAGPWLMLSHGPEESRGHKTLLIVDGVAQGLGALMMFTSFFIPEEKTENWYLIGSNSSVRLTPTNLGTTYGLGASGRF